MHKRHKWEVIEINRKYIQDDVASGVEHLTEKDRACCEIKFHKGRVYNQGRLLADRVIVAIYVMDGDGKFYTNHNLDSSITIAHSSFMAGAPVAAAGSLKIDKDGYITHINNESGHYTPGPEHLDQAINEIHCKGGAERLGVLYYGWFEAFKSSIIAELLTKIFLDIQSQLPEYPDRMKAKISEKKPIIAG